MQLARANRDHAIGTQDGFVIVVWRRRTTVADVGHGFSVLAELAGRFPQGVQLMQIVEESAIIPDAPARSALADLLRDAAGSVALSSVTHEGGGFRASLIRGIVTGLLLVSKPTFAHMVFDSTERALAKHAETLGLAPSDALILRVANAVNELRSAIVE
jgi:hypothetical protein